MFKLVTISIKNKKIFKFLILLKKNYQVFNNVKKFIILNFIKALIYF